jgi:hypothetical protein
MATWQIRGSPIGPRLRILRFSYRLQVAGCRFEGKSSRSFRRRQGYGGQVQLRNRAVSTAEVYLLYHRGRNSRIWCQQLSRILTDQMRMDLLDGRLTAARSVPQLEAAATLSGYFVSGRGEAV